MTSPRPAREVGRPAHRDFTGEAIERDADEQQCPVRGGPCLQAQPVAELREDVRELRAEGQQERAAILDALRGDGTEENPGLVSHVREIAHWIDERKTEARAAADKRSDWRKWGMGLVASLILLTASTLVGLSLGHAQTRSQHSAPATSAHP